jgi:hypothetical protein
MPDDTFRPERKKITQSEVDARMNQEEAAEMEAVARMRAMMSQQGEQLPPVGNPHLGMSEPAGPIEIKGNIPAAFKEALARKGVAPESVEPHKRQSLMNPNNPRPQTQQSQQQFTVQNGDSPLLAKLIDGVKGQNGGVQYEEIQLPSGGKFYDGTDGPRDGVLVIRPMTGDEEQILATPRFVKKGQAINMIFQRCMRDKYRSEDLLTVDRTYLLIYLRGISYSPEYDVEVKCPECDRKSGHTIDLATLPKTMCPDNYGPVLEDTLPSSGYTFRYRLARGRDEQQLQDYRDRRVKAFGEGADDTLAHRTAMLLEDIEGLQDKDDLKKLLKALPISDVSYLRSIISDPPFGVDTNIQISCPNCLHEFEIDLPLEANFFFPKARKKNQE